MHYDYIVACCEEADFCVIRYEKPNYYKTITAEKASLWYDCYQMGGEL